VTHIVPGYARQHPPVIRDLDSVGDAGGGSAHEDAAAPQFACVWMAAVPGRAFEPAG
jgi:hypothetical protein